MGSRLSHPRGPTAPTVPSTGKSSSFPRRVNSRTLMAPAAAFTMALILFVYTRTSIRAAKANAQRHRDADSGGEGLSLLNEHRRRHGMREKVGSEGTVRELGRELIGKKENVGRGKEGDGLKEEEERGRILRGGGRREG